MTDLAECIDGLPNISGSEERIRQAIQASRTAPMFLPQGVAGFGEINSCAGYLGYPFQNKQIKSSVENLARYVDK
jgi:hypothetical protein